MKEARRASVNSSLEGDSQRLAEINQIRDALERKAIKTYKNIYSNLTDKLKKKEPMQRPNPYIGSMQEIGSPHPQLENRN